MLANAVNNHRISQHGKLAVAAYPRATIEKLKDDKTFSTNVVAVEDLPREEAVAAMEWYAENTDWSAFKRKDWQAAMETLR